MNKVTANFFSWFFQPLLMASFLSAILLWFAPSSIGVFFNNSVKLWLWLVIFLTTFVVPVIGLLIMKLTSSISSIELPDRQQRIVPFFLIAAFYVIAAYLMVVRLNISGTANVIFLATAFMILVAASITIFWKISIHSMGMAGVLGFLLALNYEMPDSVPVWIVILWLLLTGYTMSSRLYLNVHRPGEVYVGSLLGFLVCYLSILIFI